MRREVSIKKFLLVFLNNFKRIILFALAVALLLGLIQGVRAWSSQRNSIKNFDTLLEVYQQKEAAYKKTINDSEKQLADLQEYGKKSIYLNLDPDNLYATRRLFLLEVEEQSVPENAETTLSEQTNLLLDVYTQGYLDDAFFDGFTNATGIEADPDYLMELFFVKRSQESASFVLEAVYSNTAVTERIADYTLNYLSNLATKELGQHKLTVASSMSDITDGNALSQAKSSHDQKIQAAEKTIKDNTSALQSLAKTYPLKSISVATILKAFVSNGFAGLFIGIILSFLYYLIKHYNDRRIFTSNDITGYYNLDLWAVIRKPRENPEKKLFHRLIQWLEPAERPLLEWASGTEVIISSIKISTKEQKGKLLLTGSDSNKGLKKLGESLQSKLVADFNVEGDLLNNPDAMAALEACDWIVLVESRGRCDSNTFNEILARIEKSGKPILGIVLV